MSTSSRLTEDKACQCLRAARKQLGKDFVSEFIRKLGYSEIEVEHQLKRWDACRLVRKWCKKIGAITSEHYRLFELVKHEIYDKQIRKEVDDLLLQFTEAKEFRTNRNRAWLLYSIAHQFTDRAEWREVIRSKLNVPESRITQFNDCKPFQEEQFRCLTFWVKRQNLNTTAEIVRELTKLNIPVRDKYYYENDDNPLHITSSSDDSSDEEYIDRSADKLVRKLRKSIEEKVLKLTHLSKHESLDLLVSKHSRSLREDFGRMALLERVTDDKETFYDMYELFDKSVQLSKEKENDKFNHEPRSLVKRCGNFVGVIGIAGIGKTTLEKLVLKAALNQSSNKKKPIAFFISYRDIDFKKPCTVLQLLMKTSHSDWKHSPKSDKLLLEKLTSVSDLYVFTDGMDEARTDCFSDDAPTMSLYDTETPDVILKNLFSGHILPNAKIMITSRPGRFQDLHPKYKPDFVANVLGLDEESQQELTDQLCDSLEEAYAVKKQLKENPVLSSFCYVPLFCKLIVNHVLKAIKSKTGSHQNSESDSFDSASESRIEADLKSDDDDVPRRPKYIRRTTMPKKSNYTLQGDVKSHSPDTTRTVVNSVTAVFAFYVNECVRSEDFKCKVANVRGLALLAMHGFLKNQICFDTEDLREAGVDQTCIEAFVNIRTVAQTNIQIKVLDGKKKYFFVHLLWQEFFTAVGLMFFAEKVKFDEAVSHFAEDSWDSVVKFLFGLCNPAIRQKVQEILQNCSAEDLPEKQQRLTSFLRMFMENYIEQSMHFFPSLTSFFAFSSVDLAKTLIPQPKDLKLLKTCNWAHELSDVAKNIADSLPDNILLSGPILPGDVTCLCKVLKASETSRSLSVGTYTEVATFIGEGFDVLFRNIRATGHQITKLHIRNQKLNLNAIQHLFDELEELGLYQCKLTVDDIDTIFNVLGKRQKPIKYLCLVDTDIGSVVIKFFSQYPQKIEMLDLQACSVTAQDTKQLAESLGQLQKPMEMLDLSSNDLCHKNFSILAQSVKFIKVLSLTGCNLNKFHVEMLASEVEKLEQPMEWLNLADNNIGRDGMKSLARCIHNIKTLGIYRCKLSEHDLDELLSAIKDLDHPMKLFNLSKNDVGRHGIEILNSCVHNIRILILLKTRLTGEDIAELAKSLGSLKEPIEFLELGLNDIKDEGAAAISECLHKVKILSLRKCGLTNIGAKAARQRNAEIGEKCKITGLDDQ